MAWLGWCVIIIPMATTEEFDMGKADLTRVSRFARCLLLVHSLPLPCLLSASVTLRFLLLSVGKHRPSQRSCSDLVVTSLSERMREG